MRKVFSIVLMFGLLLFLYACQREDDSKDSNGGINVLQSTTLYDEQYIQWIGRTHYESTTERHYFYHTASGFSVTFEGTSLHLTIHASNTNVSSLRPYFSILINDQELSEGNIIHLSQATSELVLVDNLEYGIHTVTILKRSEARDSMTSISKVETDGQFLNPQINYDMTILILGGSGISGNGVFGSTSTPRTTQNSSSLHAFGYKTASAFNAHTHFVASSGWGLKWGYNPTNANGTVNIRTAFDKVGINDQQELIDILYNPQLFIPDYIIINLGGNDYNAHIASLSGQEKTDAERAFQDAVIDLVLTLHDLYPEAYIYWTHTGSINGMLAATVLSDLDPLRSFVEVVVIYGPGYNNDPIGSGNHATEVTHQRNADILVEKINERLNRN